MAGIYIHIPYCKQKCIYCDFYFRTNQSDKLMLLKCINQEIKIRKDYLLGEQINSIYLGGGTPSIISVEEINSIIKTIYNNFEVCENIEITVECNPDNLNLKYLNNLVNSQVNRLSIGVQSFNNNDLRLLKRAHDSEKAINSIKMAQDLGFSNITIDLIYGIPNQGEKKWAINLKYIKELNIPHFSAYSLTVESNTKLYHLVKNKKIVTENDDVIANQFHHLTSFAEKNNFIHYEISNFGKEGFFSNHNTSYWKNKKYLGIGPSAHSFNHKTRQCNISSNKKYIDGIINNNTYFEIEHLTENQQYNEYILTSLRTMWGADKFFIKNKFDLKTYKYFDLQVKKWEKQEKVIKKGSRYILTSKGKLYADAIAADLFIV